INGTYKLVVGGFPVTQGGTVNADRSYEPMTITVANSENSEAQQKTLQNHKDFCNQLGFEFKPEVTCPDAGPAGMDALEASFPGIIRGTCYSHCIRKGVEGKNLLIKPKRNPTKLLKGSKKIHSTTDNTVRDYSIELWVKAVEEQREEVREELCEWLDGRKEPGVECGATPLACPRPIRPLSGTTRSLKDYVSGHVRLPLRDFIRGVGEELEFHSREFMARQFVHVPTLKKPEWGLGSYVHLAQYYKGAWCKHSIGVTMKLKLAKCPEKWVIDSVEALRKRADPRRWATA
ncbi:unnamed protein product, partial [Heterosigma akashiwo]